MNRCCSDAGRESTPAELADDDDDDDDDEDDDDAGDEALASGGRSSLLRRVKCQQGGAVSSQVEERLQVWPLTSVKESWKGGVSFAALRPLTVQSLILTSKPAPPPSHTV